jgi:hypothetical protein
MNMRIPSRMRLKKVDPNGPRSQRSQAYRKVLHLVAVGRYAVAALSVSGAVFVRAHAFDLISLAVLHNDRAGLFFELYN